MPDQLRITLATGQGARAGRVDRLGDDDLSFVLSGPVGRDRVVAFSLVGARSTQIVWGTLQIVGEAKATYGRRVRGHILTVNAEHRDRLRRWSAGQDDDSRTPAMSRSATSPTHQTSLPDPDTVTRQLIDSDALSPISEFTDKEGTVVGAPPLVGRQALRAALRRGIQKQERAARPTEERSSRIRTVLDRSGEALSGEVVPVRPVGRGGGSG